MHPFVTDSDERTRILLWLAAVSILAAWGLHELFRVLQFSPPWWLETPSVVGFYALFYTVFDKWGWRIPILRKIEIIKIPDIAGKWEGFVTSSYDEHKNHIDATIMIKQTWTKLKIQLETPTSISQSQTASIITDVHSDIISYEYINEPRAHAKATMHTHRGTARHVLKKENDVETFNGEYYTGRDRGTFGTLTFRRS